MAKRGRPRRIQPPKTTPLRGDGGAESVSQGQARVADVLEDLDGDALIENVVTQEMEMPIGEGCPRGGKAAEGLAWGDCEEVNGSPYLRAVQKEPLAECEVIGAGMKERLTGRLGAGSSQIVASSSTVMRGVTVRTKIDGEWQEVVGKKLGMGVGVRKGLGTDLAGETGSRFDVLQHQTEDLVAVGEGGPAAALCKDDQEERVPPDKDFHDYRSLEC
ncbi:hypothetical protein Dimus_028335 [Dionaea muscipula]